MSERLPPVARSLVGEFGEAATLKRFLGESVEDGYAREEYADGESVRVVLRPGDIDVPFVGQMGQEGSGDLWLVAPNTLEIGEDDRIIPERSFGTNEASEYEVSMPKTCPVNGVSVYQLDEVDQR